MYAFAKENKLIDESTFLENLLAPTGKWFNPKIFSKNVPGSQFEYSNIGATLAAYIIEQASGMAYEAFTKKYIFGPLQMTETGWEKADLSNQSFAQRYFTKQKVVPNYYLISKADGGLLTNTHDYSKFFIEMIKGFQGKGQLLSNTSYETIVVKHLVNGKTYKETAILLSITVSGVRFYIKNIYKKLHINSRSELIHIFVNNLL